MATRRGTETVAASWRRAEEGPRFVPSGDWPASDAPAWRSNGGPVRGHPARAYPVTLEAAVPPGLRRIHVLGVFAQYAEVNVEVPGTLGASLQWGSGPDLFHRVDLVNGRHYGPARVEGEGERSGPRLVGDGSSLETVGQVEIEGSRYRVEILTVDVDPSRPPEWVRFRDLGSPASFVIFDLFLEVEPVHGCPFHHAGGGVPLTEVGAALRLGDRSKFTRALDQLERSLATSHDTDEAKGQALTFAAVVAAAALELGGGRDMHRWMLRISRQVDAGDDAAEVARIVRGEVERVAADLIPNAEGPSAYLLDKALHYVDRHYAKDLTDVQVARAVGLSTSHFRFLFRQATGQPFHRYLINLRLEKARQLLTDGGLSVGEVAKAVGFTGLAHFSRAFASRFSMSPTAARRGAA